MIDLYELEGVRPQSMPPQDEPIDLYEEEARAAAQAHVQGPPAYAPPMRYMRPPMMDGAPLGPEIPPDYAPPVPFDPAQAMLPPNAQGPMPLETGGQMLSRLGNWSPEFGINEVPPGPLGPSTPLSLEQQQAGAYQRASGMTGLHPAVGDASLVETPQADILRQQASRELWGTPEHAQLTQAAENATTMRTRWEPSEHAYESVSAEDVTAGLQAMQSPAVQAFAVPNVRKYGSLEDLFREQDQFFAAYPGRELPRALSWAVRDPQGGIHLRNDVRRAMRDAFFATSGTASPDPSAPLPGTAPGSLFGTNPGERAAAHEQERQRLAMEVEPTLDPTTGAGVAVDRMIRQRTAGGLGLGSQLLSALDPGDRPAFDDSRLPDSLRRERKSGITPMADAMGQAAESVQAGAIPRMGEARTPFSAQWWLEGTFENADALLAGVAGRAAQLFTRSPQAAQAVARTLASINVVAGDGGGTARHIEQSLSEQGYDAADAKLMGLLGGSLSGAVAATLEKFNVDVQTRPILGRTVMARAMNRLTRGAEASASEVATEAAQNISGSGITAVATGEEPDIAADLTESVLAALPGFVAGSVAPDRAAAPQRDALPIADANEPMGAGPQLSEEDVLALSPRRADIEQARAIRAAQDQFDADRTATLRRATAGVVPSARRTLADVIREKKAKQQAAQPRGEAPETASLPATPAGAQHETDISGAFRTMKNAATDGYIDSMWQKVQAGEAIPRMGALENRLREAQKAGTIASRDDVAAIVAQHLAPKTAVNFSAVSPTPSTPRQGEPTEDDYRQAVQIVREQGKASVSMIQRHTGLGFGPTLKVMKRLKAEGVIGDDQNAQQQKRTLADVLAERKAKASATTTEPPLSPGATLRQRVQEAMQRHEEAPEATSSSVGVAKTRQEPTVGQQMPSPQVADVLPPKPAEGKITTAPGYSREAIEKRLLDFAQQVEPDADAEAMLATGEAREYGQDEYLGRAGGRYSTASMFMFRDKLPGEVQRFLEGRPNLRKLFKVSKAGGDGADAMGDLGDRYWEIAEELGQRGDERMQRALELAKKAGDPETQLLAALYENTLPVGERVSTQKVKASALKEGQAFTMQNIPVRVEREDGQLVLKDGPELPETPVSALASIPVDKGTMTTVEAGTPTATPEQAQDEPQEKGVLDKLSDAGDAAFERIQKRGSGRVLSGVDPRDIKDLGIVAAGLMAKAARAGTKLSFKTFVSRMKNLAGNLAEHVDRLKFRLWKEAKASLEVAIAEEERSGKIVRRLTVPQSERTQTTIRRLTGQIDTRRAMGELALLRVKMQAAARGAREGHRAGRDEARAEAKEKVGTLREKMSTMVPEAKALEGSMRQAQKASVAGYRAGVREVSGLKSELARIITENVPAEHRGEFLNQVANATTLGHVRFAIVRAESVVREYEKRQAIAELRKELAEFDPAKMAPQFRDKIEAAIGGFSLTKMSLGKRARLASMIKFAEKNPDNLLPPAMLAQAREAMEKKHVGSMTTEQIRALTNLVKHIRHLNDTLNKIKFGRQAREFDKVKEEALAAINKHTPFKARQTFNFLRQGLGLVKKTHEDADPKKGISGEWLERHLDRDTITLAMDGKAGGVFAQVFSENFRDGENERLRWYFKGRDTLHEAMRKVGLEPGSRKFKKWAAEVVEVETDAGRKVKLTRPELMEWAALMSDPETLPAILGGGMKRRDGRSALPVRLTMKDVRDVQAMLTAEERTLLETMKGFINGEFKDAQNEVWVDINGFEPLTNQDYWHRSRDTTEVQQDVQEGLRNWARKTLENLGIYKERTNNALPVLFGDVFTAYDKMIFEGSTFIGQAQPMRSALMLLGNPDVDHAVRRVFGVQRLGVLKTFVNEATTFGLGSQDMFGRIVSRLQANVAKGILGVNPQSWLKQVSGVPLLSVELGPKHVSKGLAAAGNPANLGAVWERIKQYSPILQDRYEGTAIRLVTPDYDEDAPITGKLNLAQALKENPARLLDPRLWKEHGISGLQVFDYINTAVAWHAAESKVRAEEPDLFGASFYRKVARITEHAIGRTQNAANMVDMSSMALDARKSPLARLAIMFQSQSNKMLNLTTRQWLQYQQGDKTVKDRARLLANLSTIFGSAVVWSFIVEETFRRLLGTGYRWLMKVGGEDEDDKRPTTVGRLTMETIESIGDSFYGVGKFMRMVTAYRQYGPYSRYPATAGDNPVEATAGDIAQGIGELLLAAQNVGETYESGENEGESKAEAHFWRGIEKLTIGIATLAGVPVRFPWRVIRALSQDDPEPEDVRRTITRRTLKDRLERNKQIRASVQGLDEALRERTKLEGIGENLLNADEAERKRKLDRVYSRYTKLLEQDRKDAMKNVENLKGEIERMTADYFSSR